MPQLLHLNSGWGQYRPPLRDAILWHSVLSRQMLDVTTVLYQALLIHLANNCVKINFKKYLIFLLVREVSLDITYEV